MVIALIIVIPVCIIATGFLMLKAVQLGLRWQVQVTKGEEPKLENPVAKVVETVKQSVDTKQQNEIAKYSKEQIVEWMFGGGTG